MAARFPWSHAIVRALNAPKTREQIEGLPSWKRARALQGVVQSIYGAAVSETSPALVTEYLHDLVELATPHYALPHATQFSIYRTVIALTAAPGLHPKGSMGSVAAIHVAVWANEERLHRLCALLASPATDSERLLATITTFEPSAMTDVAAAGGHGSLKIMFAD